MSVATQTPELSDEQGAEAVRVAVAEFLAAHDPSKASAQELWGAQFDAGLAWVHFPVGEGGLGVSAKHQRDIDEALRKAGVPSNFGLNVIGIGMGGPTVQTY